MIVPKKNLIYLTGFMGSGKSTIAPILANTLGYTFFDIDEEIEKATGKKVPDIFLCHGEEYFRQIERTLLQKASHEQHCVVSLGGGTIANETNLSVVKSSGILIYLKADLEHIYHRLKNKTNRPLLRRDDGQALTDEELRERISGILTAREPFYTQAHLIVETSGRKVGLTVDQIVRSIMPLIE